MSGAQDSCANRQVTELASWVQAQCPTALRSC